MQQKVETIQSFNPTPWAQYRHAVGNRVAITELCKEIKQGWIHPF
jgi:hypothetical protein